MRQIYPGEARLDDTGLAARYACPDPARSSPWVRGNMVASADGAASLLGRSGGLSGEADKHVFAMLRAITDVILVGAGTARAEGYAPVRPESEGVRWAWLREGRAPSPPIAVVTGRLGLDLDSPLLTEAPAHARTIVITSASAPAARRAAAARTADVVVAGDATVDIPAAIAALAERGHRCVLAEGGPVLLGQLITTGQLDELCLTVSPLLAGPGAGRIVAGALLADDTPTPATTPALTLGHVLTDEGFLFCRYRVGRAGDPPWNPPLA